jgi:hypothetical protein
MDPCTASVQPVREIFGSAGVSQYGALTFAFVFTTDALGTAADVVALLRTMPAAVVTHPEFPIAAESVAQAVTELEEAHARLRSIIDDLCACRRSLVESESPLELASLSAEEVPGA